MESEKQGCARCGKSEYLTRMLVCGHCGSFFCAPCANNAGNLCPQCFGLLTRLN